MLTNHHRLPGVATYPQPEELVTGTALNFVEPPEPEKVLPLRTGPIRLTVNQWAALEDLLTSRRKQRRRRVTMNDLLTEAISDFLWKQSNG